MYSQTWANGHLRIATTCPQWPYAFSNHPFESQSESLKHNLQTTSTFQQYSVPWVVVVHRFDCLQKMLHFSFCFASSKFFLLLKPYKLAFKQSSFRVWLQNNLTIFFIQIWQYNIVLKVIWSQFNQATGARRKCVSVQSWNQIFNFINRIAYSVKCNRLCPIVMLFALCHTPEGSA